MIFSAIHKKGKLMQKDRCNFNTYLVFKPEQTLRFAWEIFMMIALIFLGIIVPYSIAFLQDNPSYSSSIDYFATGVFSIDILVTLNTGIYIRGELQLKRSIIIKQYTKFWLWIDLISTLPFELILSAYLDSAKITSAITIGRNINILKLLKILKMIRLTKLKNMIMRIEDKISSKKILSLLKIVKLILYLFLVANFFACLMFLVSSSDLSPGTFANLLISSPNGFITSPEELYIDSLYWAITTMASIGYGDYSPRTPNERILGILTMNVSSLVFGYIIGNIGTVIEKHTVKVEKRRELIVNINNYMHIHKLSADMKTKVRKYINYMFSNLKNRVDLRELLAVLSQPLREEVYSLVNGTTILLLNFLKDLSKVLISRISRVLKVQVNSPHEYIFKEREDSHSMYFVTKGCVEIIDGISKSCIKILSDNSYFGEVGLFTGKTRCASVISIAFLETLLLSDSDISIISNQFPEMKKKMDYLQESTADGDLTELGVGCYLCQAIGHISKNCKKMTEYAKRMGC